MKKKSSFDELEAQESGICEFDDKKVINSVEPVKISGKECVARIDTGATRSSICKTLVGKLKLGPPIDSVEVKSSNGISMRDIIMVEVELAGVKTKTKFNVSDRSHMRYPILIGRNLLKKGFLVDCSNEDRDY
jgi:hypothetical protein